jgi:hypothetical protein
MKGNKMAKLLEVEEMLLTQYVEGAIATAILNEWRAGHKSYVFSFPGITVVPWDDVPDGQKSIRAVDLVQDGYGILLKCPVQQAEAFCHLGEDEAREAAKAFREGAEPDAKLRAKVRKMLDQMN